MKKDWQIILAHLIAQATLGILGIKVGFEKFSFDGPLSFLKVIYLYVWLAVILISISSLALFYLNQRSLKTTIYGTLSSVALWFISPFLFVYINNKISEIQNRKDQEIKAEILKEQTLTAANLMSLNSYTWNPSIDQCIIKTSDSTTHFFVLNSGFLFISTKLKLPAFNDTNTWLRLTLKEASIYLSKSAYKEIDSSIKVKNYNFSFNGSSFVKLSINTKNGKNSNFPLRAETFYTYNHNYLIVLDFEKWAKMRD